MKTLNTIIGAAMLLAALILAATVLVCGTQTVPLPETEHAFNELMFFSATLSLVGMVMGVAVLWRTYSGHTPHDWRN